jgi:hypothetical protein
MWQSKKYACGCEVRLPGNPTLADFDKAHNATCGTRSKSFAPVKEAGYDDAMSNFLKVLVKA